ncbi:MAG: hypothetical protein GY862_13730 [Gammaproteobacteria bacterium]|nr:hypothetical protein [Gammaproteobacteria bacterium]
MPYGNFKSVSKVARKFKLKVKGKTFINRVEVEISEAHFSDIMARLSDSMNFINEVTVCERIIRPILDLVEVKYKLLHIWSHVPYNVDKKKGLAGEPDYLIAPRTQYGDMSIPPLCVIEAKQEKFDEGWAQALAEMVAASSQGAKICYGVVTTGKIWEFGKLKSESFTKDPASVSATDDLQKVFGILNWLFNVANSSIRDARHKSNRAL